MHNLKNQPMTIIFQLISPWNGVCEPSILELDIFWSRWTKKKKKIPTKFDKFFSNIHAKSLIVKPLRKSSMFFFFLVRWWLPWWVEILEKFWESWRTPQVPISGVWMPSSHSSKSGVATPYMEHFHSIHAQNSSFPQ